MDGSVQLYTIRINGRNRQKVSSLPSIRGRSDMSSDGRFIVTYSGESEAGCLHHERGNGSDARVLSPAGGNAQGPSFSPNGQWRETFTAYFDHPSDDHGCEIYIMRVDGSDLPLQRISTIARLSASLGTVRGTRLSSEFRYHKSYGENIMSFLSIYWSRYSAKPGLQLKSVKN